MAPYIRKEERHCRTCLVPRPNPDGPDPCLGWLPGVAYACCGHGYDRASYVLETEDLPRMQEPGWDCPRGEAARERMRELGGNPPEPDHPGVAGLGSYWPKTRKA